MKPTCTHCETRVASKTRGLCWTCFNTPGVRDMYPLPVGHTVAERGYGVTGTSKLPRKKTTAPVGSKEKLRVMRARARAGVSLFHPDDNPDAGDLARQYATPLTADTTNEEDAA